MFPPNALIDQYRQLQSELRLERVVVVQPTTYGLDNSCQLSNLAALGPDARAVVVIDGSVTTERIEELDALGVRGARFHMLPGGAVDWDQLGPVAERIAPFGWHVQLQMNGHDLATHAADLRSLPTPLVIDHVGRFMPPTTLSDPNVQTLFGLVDAGAWVKLSAPYESAPDPTHRYEKVGELAIELIRRRPDRMLWASNWPHPGQSDPPSPADLDRLRSQWLPTDELRHRVLVENPSVLYGF